MPNDLPLIPWDSKDLEVHARMPFLDSVYPGESYDDSPTKDQQIRDFEAMKPSVKMLKEQQDRMELDQLRAGPDGALKMLPQKTNYFATLAQRLRGY